MPRPPFQDHPRIPTESPLPTCCHSRTKCRWKTKPSVRVSSSRDRAPAPSMEGSPPVCAYARTVARAQDVAPSPTVVLASSLQHLLSFSLHGVDQDGPRGGSHLRQPRAQALAPTSLARSDAGLFVFALIR
jgi:hypothetical protein